MKKLICILCCWLWCTPIANSQEVRAVSQQLPSLAPLCNDVLPSVVSVSTELAISPSAKNTNNFTPNALNQTLQEYFLQDDDSNTSLGSGFLIDSKGYIITNYHVIRNAKKITVTLHDGQSFIADLIGIDEPTDLAMIKINSQKELPFVELGDSDKLNIGDWVLAVGNPFGLGNSVSFGIVSGKSRDIDMGVYDNFIQTDASINQGSSGGPLFNMEGEVIGINTALFSSSGESIGIGFAIPVNLSKFVISELISKGKVERGWIGVKVVANNTPISISAEQTFNGGVTISEITPDSPAAKANLSASDIILSVDGNDVYGLKDFTRRIAEMPKGKSVILRIWRSNQTKDINVNIALYPIPQSSESQNITLETSPLQNEYIASLGMAVVQDGANIIIKEIMQDSQAYISGLKVGDIINQANSQDIINIKDLVSYVDYSLTKDGNLQLNITSEGQNYNLILKLERQ